MCIRDRPGHYEIDARLVDGAQALPAAFANAFPAWNGDGAFDCYEDPGQSLSLIHISSVSARVPADTPPRGGRTHRCAPTAERNVFGFHETFQPPTRAKRHVSGFDETFQPAAPMFTDCLLYTSRCV